MHWFDVREKTQFQESKLNKVNLCESTRMFCDVYCLEPGQEQRLIIVHGRDLNKIWRSTYDLDGGRLERVKFGPHPLPSGEGT